MKKVIAIAAVLFLITLSAGAQSRSLLVNISSEYGERHLEWTTSNEINSSYFLIESSGDGLSFAVVGRVKAAGYSIHLKTYDFELQERDTLLYYRITSVNMDGERYTSAITGLVPDSESNFLAHK